jgi:hypothetical protein
MENSRVLTGVDIIMDSLVELPAPSERPLLTTIGSLPISSIDTSLDTIPALQNVLAEAERN